MTEENTTTALYREVFSTEDISQGDIFFGFPLMLPDPESIDKVVEVTKEGIEATVKYKVNTTNLIVLTQACDLSRDNGRLPVKSVVCAAINDISQYKLQNVHNVNAQKVHSFYLLHKDDVLFKKSHLIEFKSTYTIPYELLSKYAQNYGNRVRPTSPILEKVSQQYGNFYSRIGLEYVRESKDLAAEYNSLKGE
ncbi:hypothetical protein [Planococcus alpniumensis]|uniref:hypothetical protein n=1 Tax=Planococcus alpniumensis TaxID=2708345 RepID=UPI001B8A9D97|nr:hypothetical protein [Planococcus sp. MSAK28401]